MMFAMKFLYTSDIHANYEHLFSMLKKAREKSVDAIVIGGDIVPHYLPQFEDCHILQAQALYLRQILVPAIEEFRKTSRAKIYLDMGNDDFICGRTILEERDGELFHLLHMNVLPFSESVDIAGYMNVPPTPYHRKDWEKPDSKRQLFAPGNLVDLGGVVSSKGYLEKTAIDLGAARQSSGNTMESDLEALGKKIRKPFIFVSHAPPYGTNLDVMYDDTHVGSLAVREFIEKWSMKNMLIASFHGHIHESPERTGAIESTVGKARCFNPGQGDWGGSRFQFVVCDLVGETLKLLRP